MSAQHTPGPWHYEPEDSGDASVGIQSTPPYIYADPQGDGCVIEICTLSEPQRKADRDPLDEYDECIETIGDYRANARLIAAAPDLLAELIEVLEWARVEQAPLRAQEMASIQAVIAKATGSQS
jgi:hypothetical protein